jgi:hypothetical protein
MGDAPVAYIEGSGGIRVAEDQIVAVGKNDVSKVLMHPSYPVVVLISYRFSPSKYNDDGERSPMSERSSDAILKCNFMRLFVETVSFSMTLATPFIIHSNDWLRCMRLVLLRLLVMFTTSLVDSETVAFILTPLLHRLLRRV